ncbi:ankyrin repeat domain-containing protein [Thiothrix nivea]|uniref:Ankyrin n=1 Tax=Thiothrix nivea (strain ATCC 35100 / DSM 5205 / JP2) TaxID=870187 RepID=A0A656HJB1_THINJ|nr:ankyrin repeat domain-containing protein [Thiothrix nivea]EIJ37008.1 Ankyrin [Thiothrix nivea DSM 5205]
MKILFKFIISSILLIPIAHADNQPQPNPLVQAVLENNPQKILKLLKVGQDVNQLAGNGEPILCAASMMGKYEAAKILIDEGAELKDSCLILAVANGNANIVSLFLNNKKSPNTLVNKNGDSLLHMAVHANYLDVTNILLKHGAKKDIKNDAGLTPSDLISQERKILDQLDILLK